MTEIKNGYVVSRDTETQEITKREKIGYIYVEMTTKEQTIGVYEKSKFYVYDESGEVITGINEEINGVPYFEPKHEIEKEIIDEVSIKYGISPNNVQVEFDGELSPKNT